MVGKWSRYSPPCVLGLGWGGGVVFLFVLFCSVLVDKSDISSERGERGTGFKKKKGTKHLLLFVANGTAQAPWPAQQGWKDAGPSVAPSPSFLSACLSLSQTKDALLKILDDVKEEDYLNFILFSGDVTTWKDNLVQATPENIQEARTFVRNIQDQGSKNRGESRLSHCSSL